MVNNYDAEAKNIGFVISNLINGYVDTMEIEESSDTPYEIYVGENDPLTVKFTYKTGETAPAGFDTSVTWSSSDETVATVDENGKVVAVGEGSATITATLGSKSATCSVTVGGNTEEPPAQTDGDSDKKDNGKKGGCSSSTAAATTLPAIALLLGACVLMKKRAKN